MHLIIVTIFRQPSHTGLQNVDCRKSEFRIQKSFRLKAFLPTLLLNGLPLSVRAPKTEEKIWI